MFKLLVILFGYKSVSRFRFLQELLPKNGGSNSINLENLLISLQFVEYSGYIICKLSIPGYAKYLRHTIFYNASSPVSISLPPGFDILSSF